MSCGCSGNCGCDEGLSVNPGLDGADAPTITDIAINVDNTLTFTFSDGSTIVTDESLTLVNSPANILIHSIQSIETVNLGTTFSNYTAFDVDHETYFTQNGDVLQFDLIFYHGQRTYFQSAPPKIRLQIGGSNIFEETGGTGGTGTVLDDSLIIDGLGANFEVYYRALGISGEITRLTNTTILVDFEGTVYGATTPPIAGTNVDFQNIVNQKMIFKGYKKITTADLSANDLKILPQGAWDANDFAMNLNKFNVKHLKLVV